MDEEGPGHAGPPAGPGHDGCEGPGAAGEPFPIVSTAFEETAVSGGPQGSARFGVGVGGAARPLQSRHVLMWGGRMLRGPAERL
jgi:hypothetical protein